MSEATDRRLVEVESRLAMQERTIEQLNEVVLEQGQRLDRLLRQIEDLAEQLRKAGSPDGPEPPPPHY